MITTAGCVRSSENERELHFARKKRNGSEAAMHILRRFLNGVRAITSGLSNFQTTRDVGHARLTDFIISNGGNIIFIISLLLGVKFEFLRCVLLAPLDLGPMSFRFGIQSSKTD